MIMLGAPCFQRQHAHEWGNRQAGYTAGGSGAGMHTSAMEL
jgi:hypothetical protein